MQRSGTHVSRRIILASKIVRGDGVLIPIARMFVAIGFRPGPGLIEGRTRGTSQGNVSNTLSTYPFAFSVTVFCKLYAGSFTV